MALFDAADLLARVKRLALAPTTDEEMADADWYALLTAAPVHWMRQLAVHAPEWNMGARELMTTADVGKTSLFGSGTVPLGGHIEIRASRTGPLLRPGPEWDPSTDYVWEGDKIRMPNNRARTFSSGPFARYVAVSGTLDGSNPPTLKPTEARELLVYRAAAHWASQGGYRDPTPFLALEQKAWAGDPALAGDVGILGNLRTAVFAMGQAAQGAGTGIWWRGGYW